MAPIPRTNSFVALDTCWIQQHGGRSLPSTIEFAITELTFAEFADKLAKPGESTWALQLLRLLDLSKPQLVIARWPIELIRRESSPTTVSHAYDAVHPELTELIRTSRTLERGDFFEKLRVARDRSPHAAAKNTWLQWLTGWLVLLREQMALRKLTLGGQPTWLSETAKIPSLTGSLASHYSDKYRVPRWNRAIARNPHRSAIGRWSGITLWYALDYLNRGVDPEPNDFEDGYLAFSASYGGAIATMDNRLQRLLRDVFPGVQLLRTLDDLNAHPD